MYGGNDDPTEKSSLIADNVRLFLTMGEQDRVWGGVGGGAHNSPCRSNFT